jgi:polysaccharide biosynthesis transport protein
MNASLSILTAAGECSEPSDSRRRFLETQKTHHARWDAQAFADEQIQNLVRQVFYPGSPRPARQVVFSGVLAGQKIASLCVRIGEALAAEGVFNVCVVEADLRTRSMQIKFGGTSTDGRDTPDLAGAVRTSSLQLSDHLWLVPAEVFAGNLAKARSVSWLRARLGVLRREFDYTVIHTPAFGSASETSLLSHVADGLVLVLEANRTRRISAKMIGESLKGSNIRLLGAVLSERTFPIPESLYRRL